MLTVWADFLASPSSTDVLNADPGGWLSPTVLKTFEKDLPECDFVKAFVCDPTKDHFGFTSWDDFFTRHFRDDVRPLEKPTDPDIVNSDVQEYDQFWIKGEKYSLKHMLNGDDLALQFYGGTVYQAFLSTTDYHRWHSPVTGTIVKTVVVPGTYYALSPDLASYPGTLTASQGFLSAMSTRALIFIESDNPSIGLMCFIAVGMIEVSSCDVLVKEGYRVSRGDQLGTFHFGGSSYCFST
jgi:phosphatidylserine decarboxylase